MVVPQPVYMNMNDLNQLAQQKAAMSQSQGFASIEEEDGPDLKTPTAEDPNPIQNNTHLAVANNNTTNKHVQKVSFLRVLVGRIEFNMDHYITTVLYVR